LQSEPNDFVIDGEILAYIDHPLNFQLLQKRIGRKNITPSILKECPVVFFAYDLLEYNAEDQRSMIYENRRNALKRLIEDINQPKTILLSSYEVYDSWEEVIKHRENSAQYFAEGIMIKGLDTSYEQGRKTGLWWKWKLDPYTVDAVMIYAQKGHGRRANLFTDYTFAIWQEKEDGSRDLVPFTKAYSGLTDKEFEEVTAFVKKNTITKFGPVYSVKPELVFELAFEGIALSNRHKSGIALRFPRMKAWRKDKKMEEADEIKTLLKMIKN
jgi:DNA ligase-1